MHVFHSLDWIVEITEEYDNRRKSNDLVATHAMLDSFFVHVRLLADFLVRETKMDKDFGPRSFGIAWKTPTTGAATRLNRHWQEASQYLVHFGLARVPENPEDLQTVEADGEYLRSVTLDVIAVMASFINALVDAALAKGQRQLSGTSVLFARAYERACRNMGISPQDLREKAAVISTGNTAGDSRGPKSPDRSPTLP